MSIRLQLPEGKDCLPISRIRESLTGQIIGQDHAIEEICRALHRGFSGLRNPNRPLAVLFFAGPTGVGKTETAKRLAGCFKAAVAYQCRLHAQCGYVVAAKELDSESPKHCPLHEQAGKIVPLEVTTIASTQGALGPAVGSGRKRQTNRSRPPHRSQVPRRQPQSREHSRGRSLGRPLGVPPSLWKLNAARGYRHYRQNILSRREVQKAIPANH